MVSRMSSQKQSVGLDVNPFPTLILFKLQHTTGLGSATRPESPFRPSVAGPALAPTPHGPSGVNCMLGDRPVDV